MQPDPKDFKQVTPDPIPYAMNEKKIVGLIDSYSRWKKENMVGIKDQRVIRKIDAVCPSSQCTDAV